MATFMKVGLGMLFIFASGLALGWTLWGRGKR